MNFEIHLGTKQTFIRRIKKLATCSHPLQKICEPVTVFEKLGNLLRECTTELFILDKKRIMDANVVRSIRSAKQTGLVRYEAYISGEITDIIRKNNYL